MPREVAPQEMKMSDSPLLKGAKPLGLWGVVLLASARAGSRDNPPEAFGFSPPLLRGIFRGATS